MNQGRKGGMPRHLGAVDAKLLLDEANPLPDRALGAALVQSIMCCRGGRSESCHDALCVAQEAGGT